MQSEEESDEKKVIKEIRGGGDWWKHIMAESEVGKGEKIISL